VKIKNNIIGPGAQCYLIAEISHNHQGDEAEVSKLIAAAAASGVSAVKFQKRDNTTLFMPDFYNKPYLNSNSFGRTYGEHREFLEPKISWLRKASVQAHKSGLDFIMTVFDEESLRLCEQQLNVDAYKIQSADLTSHYLIRLVAQTGKPYFISCGAATVKEIKAAYKLCRSLSTPFCMMYAVSEYPTQDGHVNLARFTQLRQMLQTEMVGFSCHHRTIEPAVLSRALGAIAIEKHFTMDKSQKGPDHKLSMTPSDMANLNLRLTQCDVLMGKAWDSNKPIEDYREDARFKMGKCAVAARDLKKGEVLISSDICYKSPMCGHNPAHAEKLLGKILKADIKKGTPIQ